MSLNLLHSTPLRFFGAPSSLAVNLARSVGMQLYGFVRTNRANRYVWIDSAFSGKKRKRAWDFEPKNSFLTQSFLILEQSTKSKKMLKSQDIIVALKLLGFIKKPSKEGHKRYIAEVVGKSFLMLDKARWVAYRRNKFFKKRGLRWI